MKFIKYLLVFVLGFFLYPAVFVPLMVKFASPAMQDSWIHFWARYYRFLGF